jgi:surfeit locus 1 family protein
MAMAVDMRRRPFPWLLVVLATIAFAALIGLGIWQLERLQWKQGLINTIHERIVAPPVSIESIAARYARSGDVDYWPVEVKGVFYHAGERHFFATYDGRPGFYVYTPLRMPYGRFVFINRGFIPFDLKDPQRRQQTQVEGEVTIRGLARNPLSQKPSSLVPDNEPWKNMFFWKDLGTMEATANLPVHSYMMPFFIDADATPNPGGLPVGGVTIIDLPNNHLQYALTWFGLAAALAAVVILWLSGRRKRPV